MALEKRENQTDGLVLSLSLSTPSPGHRPSLHDFPDRVRSPLAMHFEKGLSIE
jgi:hypothetical protein